jgi:hypothetical protein
MLPLLRSTLALKPAAPALPSAAVLGLLPRLLLMMPQLARAPAASRSWLGPATKLPLKGLVLGLLLLPPATTAVVMVNGAAAGWLDKSVLGGV